MVLNNPALLLVMATSSLSAVEEKRGTWGTFLCEEGDSGSKVIQEI